jgi:hypothetical protein
MAEALPKSTSELLALIENEWKALMEVAERLTPEQMTTPDAGGWSPKDNLAHLAAWMKYMKDSYLHKMPAHEAMGMNAATFKQLSEAEINAALLERNRGRSTEDVLAGLQSTYADVIETLKAMPFADLMKPLRESGPDKRLVIESVLANTSDHFREHRETIEKAVDRKSGLESR